MDKESYNACGKVEIWVKGPSCICGEDEMWAQEPHNVCGQVKIQSQGLFHECGKEYGHQNQQLSATR
jgi:hypothetical protein